MLTFRTDIPHLQVSLTLFYYFLTVQLLIFLLPLGSRWSPIKPLAWLHLPFSFHLLLRLQTCNSNNPIYSVCCSAMSLFIYLTAPDLPSFLHHFFPAWLSRPLPWCHSPWPVLLWPASLLHVPMSWTNIHPFFMVDTLEMCILTQPMSQYFHCHRNSPFCCVMQTTKVSNSM